MRDEAYAAFYASAVQNDLERIEEAARKSSKFLEDAPDGSANLREAMLVQAIKAVEFQYRAITSRSSRANPPVCTTGLATAIGAALRIANGKGLPY